MLLLVLLLFVLIQKLNFCAPRPNDRGSRGTYRRTEQYEFYTQCFYIPGDSFFIFICYLNSIIFLFVFFCFKTFYTYFFSSENNVYGDRLPVRDIFFIFVVVVSMFIFLLGCHNIFFSYSSALFIIISIVSLENIIWTQCKIKKQKKTSTTTNNLKKFIFIFVNIEMKQNLGQNDEEMKKRNTIILCNVCAKVLE